LTAHPQIIRTASGEELVVLSRDDYDALAARAGDPVSEDAMTARILDSTDAEIAAGRDVALPESVWKAIEAGDPPIAVLRRHRGLSIADLSTATGIEPDRLAALEAGAVFADPLGRRRLATALAVSVELLFE